MFVETSYIFSGLGQLPLDYVFAGAQVVYSATVEATGRTDLWYWPEADPNRIWKERFQQVLAAARSHYEVVGGDGNPASGSIFFNLRIPSDMGSIEHIRATLDGAVRSAGFSLKASMVRFTSNPRRDGQTQPPAGTPGVPPPVTQLPPAAGNVDTSKPPGTFDLLSALDAWGAALGITRNTLIAGGALLLLLLIKK